LCPDHDEGRLKGSQDALKGRALDPGEQAPPRPRHLEVGDGEESPQHPPQGPEQHGGQEHDHVHRDRVTQLHIQGREQHVFWGDYYSEIYVFYNLNWRKCQT
jgi:hypothetical protein